MHSRSPCEFFIYRFPGLVNIIKVVSILKRAWTHIPQEIRTEVNGGSTARNTKTSGIKRKATKALDRTYDEHATVSNVLEANLNSWKQNPLSFFVDTPNIKFNLEESPLAEAYRFLTHLESRRGIDLIRARLLKVIFHHLKSRLSLPYFRPDNLQQIAQLISRSGIVECNLDTIKGGLNRWSNEGSRIDSLCRDVACDNSEGHRYLGTLFLLPAHVNGEL